MLPWCRARDKRTGKIYALKKVKLDTRRDREGFPLTALREVNVLLSLLHPNVVTLLAWQHHKCWLACQRGGMRLRHAF